MSINAAVRNTLVVGYSVVTSYRIGRIFLSPILTDNDLWVILNDDLKTMIYFLSFVPEVSVTLGVNTRHYEIWQKYNHIDLYSSTNAQTIKCFKAATICLKDNIII